jgi:hypothetical protein
MMFLPLVGVSAPNPRVITPPQRQRPVVHDREWLWLRLGNWCLVFRMIEVIDPVGMMMKSSARERLEQWSVRIDLIPDVVRFVQLMCRVLALLERAVC